MERDLEQIKNDLVQLSDSHFITKWILEHTPYIFDNDEKNYIEWRMEISKMMRVDPSDIHITGSAALGFSLNPHKNFKLFDEKSDIDICIISHLFFDIAWYDLIHTKRSNLPPKMQTALDEHRNRLIYWGTIATDKLLPLLSFGRDWDKIITQNSNLPALAGRTINFRIYKDTLSFRNYVSESVNNRRIALLEE